MINIDISNEYNNCVLIKHEEIIISVIKEVFKTENIKSKKTEVSILIVDNEKIRTINNKFRKMYKSTDVLSFPLLTKEEIKINNELILGDIIVSFDKVISQSKEYGHSIERELAFLIVHGMLHLLGYDHITSAEEESMLKKQNLVLSNLNIIR